jgi:hypothetical protein
LLFGNSHRESPFLAYRVGLQLTGRLLALIVLLRTETWQARRGMIEYNLTFLRQGVRRILMEL